MPFENSSNGPVVFTLDLFVDSGGKNADIIVTDEIYLPVSHCLVGIRQQLATSAVTKVYSHPQAWGQCKRFLSTALKGVERQDVSSTSRAAQVVAEEGSTSAAISSKLAAEIHGLDVLAEGIEDRKENTTRFFIIRHQTAQSCRQTESSYKTMVSFTVDHDKPGALADALAVFKVHGLTLTSINTRPGGGQNWMYVFFVEFRGHVDAESVKVALDELRRGTKTCRMLGSWKDALA